jgi:hypothetical protein
MDIPIVALPGPLIGLDPAAKNLMNHTHQRPPER